MTKRPSMSMTEDFAEFVLSFRTKTWRSLEMLSRIEELDNVRELLKLFT